jgi:hypothetical protein
MSAHALIVNVGLFLNHGRLLHFAAPDVSSHNLNPNAWMVRQVSVAHVTGIELFVDGGASQI